MAIVRAHTGQQTKGSIRRTTRRHLQLAALAAMPLMSVFGAAQSASAATQYWDIDDIVPGAGGATPSGTWDGVTSNWGDVDGVATATTWTAGSDAVFAAGTDATGSYTLTISGTQSLVGLTMEEGTTISTSGGTLDFGATVGAPINIATGTFSQVAGTVFTGTRGLVKSGAGTLQLRGTNTYSNTAGAGNNPYLTITGGVVDFITDLNLGAVPAANTTTGVLTLNGGTLRYNNTTSHTLNVNRNVAIGASGGTIEVTNSANTGLSLPGSASGTLALTGPAGATLTKTGAGRFTLNTTQTGYLGKFRVTGGTLNSAGDGRFGPVPGSVVADYFFLDGGALRDALTSGVTWSANRGITLGAGGGTLMQPGGGTTTDSLTYNGIIAGTAGGNLTITNSDPAGGGSTDGIVILGGANTYNGALTTVTAAMILRLGATGSLPNTTVVNLTGAGAQFDIATNSVNETIKSVSGTAGTVAVGGATLTIDNPAGETYSSVFTATAAGKVIKNGSGAWSLGGSSTGFNGEFVLNSGTLGVGSSNAFGNGTDGADASTLTISGGVLSNTGSGGRTIPAGVSVNLNSDVTVNDSLFSGPGQILFNGTSTMSASRTITVNGTANLNFANIAQSAAGQTVTKEGSGILVLSGNNSSYTGDTNVNNGTLRFTSGTAGTQAGTFFVNGGANTGRLEVDADGVVASGTNTINLAGGILSSSANRSVQFSTPVNVTANSAISTTSAATTANFDFDSNTPFNVTGGSTITIRNDGADAITDKLNVRLFGNGFDITTPIDLATGASSSTPVLASFNTTGTFQSFSGGISGTGSYNRSASTSGTGGDTFFPGPNTYSGGTTINDGRLFVTNTTGSATGTGAVAVNTGGTLGGTGTISGVVSVGSGGHLAPGTSIGTISVGSLSLSSGSHLDYELDAPSTGDQTVVTTASGLSFVNGSLIEITNSGAGVGVGTYTLIDYDTSFAGSLSSHDLVVNTGPAGFEYELVDNVGNTSIDLVVTASVGGDSTWKGDFSGAWTPIGNWLNGSPNAVDAVATLGSVISAPRTVTLNGAKTVGTLNLDDADGYVVAGSALTLQKGTGSAAINALNGSHSISAPVVLGSNTDVTVTNLADTVTMSGDITGTGMALTKLGAGTLILSGAANAYSGGTTVSAGVLQGTTGGLQGAILNNASVVFDQATSGTYAGAMTGTGSLTKQNTGAVALSGTAAHTGATSVTGGTLLLQTNLLGSSSVSVSGATSVLELATGGGNNRMVQTPTVSTTTGGKVNLQDNKMILTGMSETAVTSLVASGYNGGAWNGTGIGTTQADAVSGKTALGVAVASAVRPGTDTFGGIDPADTDVLVMYTYGGDADLNGIIDGDDFAQIDNGYSAQSSGWYNGDFNYSGGATPIDADDYFIIDSNYAKQTSTFPNSPPAGGVTAVPEPTALFVLPMLGAGLVARRRRTR